MSEQDPDTIKARVVKNLEVAIRAYGNKANPLSEQSIATDFLTSKLSPSAFYDAARRAGYSPEQIGQYAIEVLHIK